MHHTVKRL